MTSNKKIETMVIYSIGKGNFSIVNPHSQNYLANVISAMQDLWNIVHIDPFSGKHSDMLAYTERATVLIGSARKCRSSLIRWCKVCHSEFGMDTHIKEIQDKGLVELVPCMLSWYESMEKVILDYNSKRIAG